MSNYRFRVITNKIRDCYKIDEKIILIKKNIKSLEDLIDMLDAECLFDNEFYEYFKSVSQMESIILFKYLNNLGLDMTYEKEWYVYFKKYLENLNINEESILTEISNKIIFVSLNFRSL